MSVVIVGKTFEKEFGAVLALAPVLAGDDIRIEGGEVWYGGACFRFDGRREGVSFEDEAGVSEQATAGFTKEGATWFEGLRSAKASAEADFRAMLDYAAANYRSHYTVVRHEMVGLGEGLDAPARQCAQTLLRTFGVTRNMGDVSVRRSDGEYVDYCGVTLRLELGESASVVVLGRIFFSGSTPLEASKTKDILESINKIRTTPGKSAARAADVSPSDYAQRALSAMEGLQFLLTSGALDLSKVLVLDKEDEDTIKRTFFPKKMEFAAPIPCKVMRIVGVYSIRYKATAFTVRVRGKDVLSFEYGLSGNVTVRCLNCGELLVDEGRLCLYGEENSRGLTEGVLDFSQEATLGLSDEELEIVAPEGDFTKGTAVFNDHLRENLCRREAVLEARLSLAPTCEKKFICRMNGEEGEVYCKDCPHPEVSWFDADAGITQEATDRRLVFDYTSDERGEPVFLPKDTEGIKECPTCGRMYLRKGDRRYCLLCETARGSDEAKKEEAKKLYSKYRRFVSPSVRRRHLTHEKLCFEDAAMLIFRLGGEKGEFFVMDKREIPPNGDIPIARKPNAAARRGKGGKK